MNTNQENRKDKIIILFGENTDTDITARSTREAMITFTKLRLERPDPEQITVPADVINDPDRLFHFARIYQNALLSLYAGKMEVWPQIDEMFNEPSTEEN